MGHGLAMDKAGLYGNGRVQAMPGEGYTGILLRRESIMINMMITSTKSGGRIAPKGLKDVGIGGRPATAEDTEVDETAAEEDEEDSNDTVRWPPMSGLSGSSAASNGPESNV